MVIIVLMVVGCLGVRAQAPHIYEHTYPVVASENPQIRALMDSVAIDSIEAYIEHLCSYHNRRYDSRYIWEVQDWLVSRYQAFGVDTVMLHDFPVPDSTIETADNIIAVQWGAKTPQEFVVCGAHYDSWNDDGEDPDTIRSPGADDNASGVAGILETARLLSHYTFDRSIIYANWCAEEIGLVGSAAYARDMAEQGMDIVGYFNLDMTGYLQEGSDIHVHLMYTTQDSTIADYVYGFSHTYFPDMPIHQDWLAWGDSDYSSFNRNGYPAVHPFEDVRASSPYIHSRQDVLGLSVNSLEQSKRFTELNLGLVATLAGLQNHDVIENECITIALYPNPAKESVTILADDELQHVTVINLIGQSLAHNVVRENNKYVLDINQFPSGIYLLKISTKRGTATQRLVVL
ncbi:MAG: peptidase M20/M25/M40 family protein [bacterium F082]|nr:MAG: peptidase M20/M25/M40 family protein [bacterium F082]KWW28232.1 MAG: peptidase M20/M25/M40 family protein [bacterium P201]